jgi:hypothetical protein
VGASMVCKNNHRIVLSICLVLLALLTGGLSAAAADKIRIGYSGATVSNAMLWVTDEGKLFQKNGIDPQILYLQTTLGQTAMIAGEIDNCRGSQGQETRYHAFRHRHGFYVPAVG